MNTVLLIIQGINVAGTLLVEVQKVKALMEQIRNLDPDASVNIRTLTGQTYTVNNDTIAGVEAWLAKYQP